MARFKFRMQPLLKMRKLKQEMFERELSKILSELMYCQNQLEGIEHQLALYYEQIRNKSVNEDMDIGNMIADRRYLNHLHMLKMSQEQIIGNINENVKQARRKLAEAKKQTDIMKKLKEHRYKEFLKEIDKQEVKESDDIVNARIASNIQREKLF